MAVSVNTVYQTVLYILNKEQRGYITPAEFNSISTQVQDEIFQSYFPDGNQVNRQNQNNTQNDTEFFNMFKDISYKLHPFERELVFTYSSTNQCFYNNTNSTLFKIGEVITTYSGQPQYDSITQLVSKKDFDKIIRSKLTAPTKQNPIFRTTSSETLDAEISINSGGAGYVDGSTHGTVGGTGTGFTVVVKALTGSVSSVTVIDYGQGYSAGDVLIVNGGTTSAQITITPLNRLALKISPNPSSVSDVVSVNCLLKPTSPVWDYSVGSVGQYSFLSVGSVGSNSVNFELDTSEQTGLIMGILKYCGIIVNDPTIIQVASQEAAQAEANEKS